MAESQVSVKLGLNTDEFDKNINKSRKQIQQWKNQTQVVGKEMVKGFGVLASAVLGAQGAAELFNKTINSTQATGDAFQKMLDQTTASSNLFFASIAQGDFTLFLNGLKSAITEAGKLSTILDNLATNKLFSTPQLAKLDRDIAGQTQIVKDKSKSVADQKAAAERVKLLQAEKKAIKELTVNQSLDAGYQGFRVGLTSVGYNNEASNKDIDLMMELLRTGEAGNVGSSYSNLLAKSKELIPNTQIQTREAVRAEKELKDFLKTEAGRLSQMAFFANKAPDDQNSNFFKSVQDLTYAYNAQTQLIQEETAQKRAENMIRSSGSGEVTAAIKDINQWYNDDGRIKVEIEPDFDTTKFRYKAEQALSDKANPIQIPIGLPNVENITSAIAPKEIENIDINDQIGQFTNLASAIGSVTGAVNSGASGWISWGASLLTAIGTAIPAITALTAVKTAEANANAKAAVTGAAASVASIPVVGWIMAGAAVASVIASMIAVPKFATGGIVGGGSVSGDKIPALLNSGEMVLNDRQQTNLFNQLNSGSIRGNNVNITGELRLQGSDLIAAVRKNEKINNRI